MPDKVYESIEEALADLCEEAHTDEEATKEYSLTELMTLVYGLQ